MIATHPNTHSVPTRNVDVDSLTFSKLALTDSPVRFVIDLDSRNDTERVSSEALLAAMASAQAVSAHAPDGKATSSLRLSTGGLLMVRVQPRVDSGDSDDVHRHDRSSPSSPSPSGNGTPAQYAIRHPFPRRPSKVQDDDATLRASATKAGRRSAVGSIFGVVLEEVSLPLKPPATQEKKAEGRSIASLSLEETEEETIPQTPVPTPIPTPSPSPSPASGAALKTKVDYAKASEAKFYFVLDAQETEMKNNKVCRFIHVVYPKGWSAEGVEKDVVYLTNVVIGFGAIEPATPGKSVYPPQSVFDIGIPTGAFEKVMDAFAVVCQESGLSDVDMEFRSNGVVDGLTWVAVQGTYKNKNRQLVDFHPQHAHLANGNETFDLHAFQKEHWQRRFLANVGLRLTYAKDGNTCTPVFSFDTVECVDWTPTVCGCKIAASGGLP